MSNKQYFGMAFGATFFILLLFWFCHFPLFPYAIIPGAMFFGFVASNI